MPPLSLVSSALPPPLEPSSQTLLLIDEEEAQHLSRERKMELDILQIELIFARAKAEGKTVRLEAKKAKTTAKREVERSRMEVELLQMEQEKTRLLLSSRKYFSFHILICEI